MRIVIPRESMIWIRRAQRVAFVIAILLLGYSGFLLANTWVFQRNESVRLEHLVQEEIRTVAVPAPVEDGLIGRIDISRLGVSVIVLEGDAEATLQHAAGHITGTALPGQPGNTGIAGHRDTLFRPLQNIRNGDVITLTTPAGEFRYQVSSTRVVSPDEVSVLESDNREILTLVTCYPFYFVGPAPGRFIVRADRTP